MYLPPENAVSRTGEKELIIPNKIFIEPAAGIDQNGSTPPPHYFLCWPIYNTYFFSRPRYPEKKSSVLENEINPGSIWTLADNKVKRMISGLPIGWECESQNPLKTGGIVREIKWLWECVGGSAFRGERGVNPSLRRYLACLAQWHFHS